ncbi:MAG: acyltransferase, partial [Verrucomicrobiae bacterium]|nr:acyltransferase [Verrucomicrobiae bacterium]
FLLTKETPFPGLAAVPPCVGTALFILGTSSSANAALPLLAKPFIWRPIIFIGLISYSLYLWHWPLVAFSHYWALEDLTLMYRFGIVVVGIVLAVVSWRFVETPFRKRRLGASRHVMFAWAGVGLLFISCLGLVFVVGKGMPNRFPLVVYAFDQAKSEALHDNRITEPVDLEAARAGEVPRLGAPAPAPLRLLVWGDSHARSILPAVVRAAEENNAGILTAWHSSTPPVVDYVPHPKFAGFSLGDDCPAYARALIDLVADQGIGDVLLAARWSGFFEADRELSLSGSPPQIGVAEALIRTTEILESLGVNVWILRE